MKKHFFNKRKYMWFLLAQFVMVITWIFTFGAMTVIIHIGHDTAAVIQGWGVGTVELNFDVEAPL